MILPRTPCARSTLISLDPTEAGTGSAQPGPVPAGDRVQPFAEDLEVR